MRAYFDYNASSPLRPQAQEAMVRALADCTGNPSSAHAEGRRARALVETAREQLAALLGVPARRVVFTSGATESNNAALRGFLAVHPEGIIATSVIEHHSILATVAALEAAGARILRLGVDRHAQPDIEPLHRLGTSVRCMLSLSLANGETGHVLDLDRVTGALPAGTLLHLDAAQAVGRVALPAPDRFDLSSLSAHKFGGPKGVGAWVVPVDPAWSPALTGGPQERSLRAGTENVVGIVGMGAAAQACRESMDRERVAIGELRDQLWRRLSAQIDDLLRLTPGAATSEASAGLFNTLTLSVPGLTSDVLVAALDLAGYAVSAGSACAAGSPEPSHVVAALGIDPRFTGGVVRISLGFATTPPEVAGLADAFVRVVGRARQAA